MTKKRKVTLCLSLGVGLVLALFATQAAMASGGDGFPDPFFLIKKTITMAEVPLEVPVPDYEYVDVAGSIKNDPADCGGAVAIDNLVIATGGDMCLLRPQMTFSNGYFNTSSTVVTPNRTAYNGKSGNYEIYSHVGDIVQLTVRNELPEAVNGAAIGTGFFAPADNRQLVHWHGMELDNESDGTPITEFGIETGQQRLYQFRMYRPGPYWFHPHILPLLTESRGLVAKNIVRTYEEDLLTLVGVLPFTYKPVQLWDGTVANAINKTHFRNNVVFDGFTQQEVDNHLMPNIAPDLNGDGVCNRGPGDCVVSEGELVFVNGVVPTSDYDIPTIYVPETQGVRVQFLNSSDERFYRFRLLLDGEEPPGASGDAVPAERVNRATTGQCYADGSSVPFTGGDPLSCDQGLPLYRVGGQNGLLDHVRLEGQPEIGPAATFTPRSFDTVIRTGEDFIGISERTDLVLVTKDRYGNYLEPGDQMFIWLIDYPHGVFADFFGNNIGDGDTNNRDVAPRKLVRIKIVPNILHLPPFDIHEGDPIMAHPLINRPAEDLHYATTVELSDVPTGPEPFLPPETADDFHGSTDENIVLGNRVANNSRFPSINAVKGLYSGAQFTSMGNVIAGDNLPTQDATRYARIGDVVEFVYANNTANAHHPLHLHGFSIQPVAIYNFDPVNTNPGTGLGQDNVDDSAELTDLVYTYDYNEFIDVEVMQPGKALVFRMKMNDRFKIPDDTEFSYLQLLAKFPYDYHADFGGPGDLPNYSTGADMGGGVGRWLFHCHILHHANLGMISDLCVAPAEDEDASGCKIETSTTINQPIP